MKPYGVTVIDLSEKDETDHMRILAGYESKVFAMFHSGYEECLYLDADNIPLMDPTFLFDGPQYQHWRSIFWPDIAPARAGGQPAPNRLPECVWTNLGMTYRNEVDFETGQFLVDMRSCWREMCLARWINSEHSDYYYKFIFGDKSTFHLAWAKLDTNWSIPRKGAGGNQGSLIQHDFQGRELFQHCVQNKPTLRGYPSPRQREPARWSATLHLEQLRGNSGTAASSGTTRIPRRRKADLIRCLTRSHLHLRADHGKDKRPMRFLEDGRIGRGLARLEGVMVGIPRRRRSGRR